MHCILLVRRGYTLFGALKKNTAIQKPIYVVQTINSAISRIVDQKTKHCLAKQITTQLSLILKN